MNEYIYIHNRQAQLKWLTLHDQCQASYNVTLMNNVKLTYVTSTKDLMLCLIRHPYPLCICIYVWYDLWLAASCVSVGITAEFNRIWPPRIVVPQSLPIHICVFIAS